MDLLNDNYYEQISIIFLDKGEKVSDELEAYINMFR